MEVLNFLPGPRGSGTQVRFPVEAYPWHLMVGYGNICPVSIFINGVRSACSITCDTAELKKRPLTVMVHMPDPAAKSLGAVQVASEERVTYGKRRRPTIFQLRMF